MKKKWIIIISIGAVLLILRLSLPFLIKHYVNKTLNNIEGYQGAVEDIDLNLFRGAYVIDNVSLSKTEDSIPVPFINIHKIDLSIHWRAIFNGSIVGEIILTKPELNFAVSKSPNGETVSQDGSETDWTEPINELMPLKINRFEIKNGKMSYKDFTTTPEVDVFLDNLQLVATNLSNVKDKNNKLPSSFKVKGNSLGGGKLDISANLNLLKKIPDMDLNLKFENADLIAFNNFTKAYTNIDVEEGTFNLYSEIVINDADFTGYVKPVMENLKIIEWNEGDSGFTKKIWEVVAGGLAEIFENQPKDQFASKVPIEGNLNDLEAGVWASIGAIFKNAFIEALSKNIEGSIDFSDNSSNNKK